MSEAASAKQPKRRVRRQFWEDDAFRQRIAVLAKARGVTVREAMGGAGVALDYTYKAQASRGINQLMAIANYFEVPLEQVLGVISEPPRPLNAAAVVAGPTDGELGISETALRIVLKHADRWLFLALTLNRHDTDPLQLAAALNLEIAQLKPNGEATADL